MALAICALGANAQNTKVITGAVIDKNGNPLPNALVEATGGAESVTTDADGSFRIEVPIWLKSLTAKYAGLKDNRIKINNRSQLIFEMKPQTGSWFLDAAYSVNFGDVTFSRAGLMGGYLGNWGGYAKVMMPFGGDLGEVVPSVTIGAIKQIAKPAYLYLGAGYSPVFGIYYSGYSNYYNGTYNYYSYSDYEGGAMFEAGAIFKFNKINFSIGYAFSTSFDSYTNHSLQFSVGYCF